MELSQASSYFSTVSLDGWNEATQSWISGIAAGDFLTYDRFLGPRTFGHLQRMFHMTSDGSSLMPYEVVRSPEGQIYLVASFNHDFHNDEAYATSFLLQQAQYTVGIVEMVTVDAPSGIGGTVTPTVIATVHGNRERYTSQASDEVDVVRYETFIFNLPLSALDLVNTDSELKVGDIYYEVKELGQTLNVLEVRALERGA